jgi:hypothetical protein
MPTQNPRINITFEPQTVSVLASLAQEEHTSISRLAKELILEALERREDIALSTIANLRDIENIKPISHQDAWK